MSDKPKPIFMEGLIALAEAAQRLEAERGVTDIPKLATAIPAMVEQTIDLARDPCDAERLGDEPCIPETGLCRPCMARALLASAGIEWRET